MAGIRTVAIKFTGDTKGLEQAADKAASGLSNVADKADNLDSKSGQATDSLGALSSGFELVGLGQYAAGLQGAAMATDFLSGVGTGLNLVMQLQSVQFIKAKVEALAYAVQQKAIAAATKVWAAVQWGLNAAMSANPISLVVLAIAALIAIVILAWQRSSTFRTIVTGAFNAVKAAASAVASFFTDKLWPGVKWAWDKISGGATAAKNTITGGFDAVVGFVKGLPKRISSAASGMFDGITGAFKSAINWVIGKWNGLEFRIPGVDTHIPGVGTVGGFTLGTPNIPMLAKGGTAVAPGLALVGENGPELLAMNRGASVIPLDQGGGDTLVYVTIDGEQLQGRIDKTVRGRDRQLRRKVRAA